MWVFTKDGFFSVVRDRFTKRGHIMVRARCRDDLERLAERIRVEAEILELGRADYRFRMQIPNKRWGHYLRQAGEAIDYPNFKHTVRVSDPRRLKAYMGCWSALRRWQDEL
jgi:hypothetical protein